MNTESTTKNQITEADVVAFMMAVTAKYAPLFPEVREFCATTSLNPTGMQCGFFGYRERFNAITAYATNFEEAAHQLREELGTPQAKSAKLREEAASLLAEAERLSQLNLARA